MRCGAGGTSLGRLLLVVGGGDPGDAAQPVDTVFPDLDAVLVLEFVSDEPVAQRGVVGVDVVDDVEQVRVVPVPLADGILKPCSTQPGSSPGPATPPRPAP